MAYFCDENVDIDDDDIVECVLNDKDMLNDIIEELGYNNYNYHNIMIDYYKGNFDIKKFIDMIGKDEIKKFID